MPFSELTVSSFTDTLASSAPVPGGGGVSALVGSLGAALGSMVCALTEGKKKYAAVQDEIAELMKKTEALRADLLTQIDADAECFAPLATAYRLPSETEEEKAHKAAVLEETTKAACAVPIAIMEKAMCAIELHGRLAEIGSRLAISDVGVGVLLCKSALFGASLNVFINTKALADRTFAEETNRRVERLLAEGGKRADEIYASVLKQIQ